MADIFRSARLIYRAVSPDDDLSFFLAMNADNAGYQNSVASNIHLATKNDAKDFMKSMSENLLGAVICLPTPTPSNLNESIPIGQIHLTAPGKHQTHHRNTEIAVGILPAHQGRGYGSEAIGWALEYSFRWAGLHRVRIRAFEWNDGAVRLYERLGFKSEGREREVAWHDGKWRDGLEFGMLEEEWRELQRERS